MSLPPERISIKRRRQDEPVDTLILEQGLSHDKKRRFTDFYFQRVRYDEVELASPRQPSGAKLLNTTSTHSARDYEAFGIPTIRSTAPGDEVRDFANYKAAHKDRLKESEEVTTKTTESQGSPSLNSESTVNYRKAIVPTRRFHLTSDLSSALKPNRAGGIRRNRISLRPPLATFIERPTVPVDGEESVHKRPPVDSIVELNETAATDGGDKLLTEASINRRTKINTFLKSPHSATKRGRSIRDDPKTWDQDSDQLANELAALAFDIDPADAAEPPHVIIDTRPAETDTSQTDPAQDDLMFLDGDEDFIFETYVRVKHDSDAATFTAHHNVEIGVLVIDDENEDLWEKYIHSDDDDDEWDEEDEDSNAEDNPRNEYPDDEVSTDDEYGRNVYKYRRNASDDEQFDESNEQW